MDRRWIVLGLVRPIAEIDDAEKVTFGIGEYHEIRVVWIAVPVDVSSTERDEPRDFGFLFSGVGHMKVKMEAGMILRRSVTALQGDADT